MEYPILCVDYLQDKGVLGQEKLHVESVRLQLDPFVHQTVQIVT